MESFATPYTVIFNDGDNELDKGIIGIHSCLTFKRFQSMVGQKTGLPAAQLTTVFVCRRTVGGVEKKQKLPINENTNFAIIISQHHSSKERDCFFLVSLKKSKKERKASKKRVDAEFGDDDLASRREEGRDVSGEIGGEDGKADKSAAGIVADENQEPTDAKPAVERSDALKPESDERPIEQPKAASPAGTPTLHQSAWKTGSILQRLSSGDLKHSSVPTLEQGHGTSGPCMVNVRLQPVQCHVQSVTPTSSKGDKTSGTVSPTSVLEMNRLRPPLPVVPPSGGSAYLPSGIDLAGFTMFGQDPRAVDLRHLLGNTMVSNIHLKTFKWCRFCAFCRERNMPVAPFHWCVDDQVVSGFRGPNPAGPIGTRAMKQRVAAA